MVKSINSVNSFNQIEQLENISNRSVNQNKDINVAAASAVKPVDNKGQIDSQSYQFFIKFKPGVSEFQRLSLTTEIPMRGFQQFSAIPGLSTVTISSKESPEAIIKQLQQSPYVEFAELDKGFTSPKAPAVDRPEVDSISARPNDRYYYTQWTMKAQGPSSPGSINAENAWEMTVGSRDVVVAYLDTGMDYEHPDLQENLWTNEGEIEGNGIDDDNNGVIDDIHGYNAIGNDGSPIDDNSHGTLVAGIIGATGDNGSGVTGVAQRVKVMPIKITPAEDRENKMAAVLRGIDYIIKMKERGANIRVLSNSWGGDPASPALREAIAALDRAGILFVAAAGNNGGNNDENPIYPAAYDLPNVLSVAATDDEGKLAGFSNYGQKSVHIAAPGVDVVSTRPGGYYSTFGGTSAAAPFVAGAAALLLSRNPDLSPEEVKQILMDSATKKPDLDGKIASGGLLNVGEAVRNTPMKWIKLGDTGDNVKQIQELLNRYGYELLEDGEFGAVTESAVKDFQRRSGLVPDGEIGPLTLAALRED